MKAFTNANPRDLAHALTIVRQTHQEKRSVAIAGGGTDLLGMMKERLVTPDVVVHLGAIKHLELVKLINPGVTIGGQITLDALAATPVIRQEYPVLAEAAASVATPQIRNVATLAGNLCQRPWCWYYRNGFKCLKNGGTTCYSISGENEFHAIFGGGPSYIVHPSDTAPALVALDATFRIVGTTGERKVPASRSRGVDARRRQRRHRARHGQGRVPQCAGGAGRRGADSVAAAGGGEAADRQAHHAGARGRCRSGGRGRRATAGEERLQGADDAGDGPADD